MHKQLRMKSTTTTVTAREVNLRREALTPTTPMVDMEILETQQNHIYHIDSLACQDRFEKEGCHATVEVDGRLGFLPLLVLMRRGAQHQ